MAERTGLRGVCGIDLGGSGCRAVVGRLNAEGSLSAGTMTGLVHRNVGVTVGAQGVDPNQLADALEPAARAAAAEAGVEDFDAVAVGAASLLGLLPDVEPFHQALAARLRTKVTVAASDMVTSHAGALGFQSGAVLAAGTGAVALGTDFRDNWHRVDGWGHILGDDGGGAWIGASGLKLALRSMDGRVGGSVPLQQGLISLFGSKEALIQDVYTRSDRAGLLASFVPVMASHSGEPDVRRIFAAAGAALADTAAAALPSPLPPRLALVGGLFNATPLIRKFLLVRLTELRPDVAVRDPEGTSLDGALQLAVRAARGEVQDTPPYVTVRRH